MTTETDIREPYVFDAVPVDAYMAVGAVVRAQWGDYGYSIATKGGGFGAYLFGVRHSDGSEFHLLASRRGKVWEAVWNGHGFDKGRTL